MTSAAPWQLPARPALRHSGTIKAANRGAYEHDVCGNGLMRAEVAAVKAEHAVMPNPAFNRTPIGAVLSGRAPMAAGRLTRTLGCRLVAYRMRG